MAAAAARCILLITITLGTCRGEWSPPDVTDLNEIYIAGFLPETDTYSREIVTAVDLALDHINKSPAILKDHHLKILWGDTKVRS